jgi:hypothetical protein
VRDMWQNRDINKNVAPETCTARRHIADMPSRWSHSRTCHEVSQELNRNASTIPDRTWPTSIPVLAAPNTQWMLRVDAGW